MEQLFYFNGKVSPKDTYIKTDHILFINHNGIITARVEFKKMLKTNTSLIQLFSTDKCICSGYVKTTDLHEVIIKLVNTKRSPIRLKANTSLDGLNNYIALDIKLLYNMLMITGIKVGKTAVYLSDKQLYFVYRKGYFVLSKKHMDLL